MSRTDPHGDTLLLPKEPTERPSAARRLTTALPTDLLNQGASRLQSLALLYAFTFFMANFVPTLIFEPEMLQRPLHTLPGVVSIVTALAFVALLRTGWLQPHAVMLASLVFEVISSYGIAAAEFFHPPGLVAGPTWIGLSWVAVWVLIFNVVVPIPPRIAVLAALGAVSAVPVVVLASLSVFPPAPPLPDGQMIFWAFGFPYLLVVIMAYVGARVVYALGREVSRARELGSYRLVERLGAGGMGEVWKASHRFLARPAAIKLIRPSVSGTSEEARRRFEREAQTIARLRSPNTVTLFDFGVAADDGAFYYVMELLEGLDADTLVRRFGPMTAERVAYVLRQICHSLSEAHACGLVHRDIKPANIFLCRYGEDHDFVKVLDFGIAKPAHEISAAAETQTALTVANVIHGTPAFIAPEQAVDGGAIDHRADIYSVGCVAYWLLTGELVFTGNTPMKLLLAHANAEPEPPSARAELPIPRELDALVLSCLAKDREQRPPSARSLMERLDAIAFRSPWTGARAREWWAAHLPG